MDVSDRFWSKVDIRSDSECWEWTAKRHVRGYGIYWHDGKNVRANRHALFITSGPPPFDDAISLHSCDNPPCCNPAHLRWGTHKENVDDRKMRRGSLVGEDSPVATITNEIVAKIYRCRLDGLAVPEIAELLQLPKATVLNVYSGRSWTHRLGVDGNPTLKELRSSKVKRKRKSHNRVLTDKMIDAIFQGRMAGKSGRDLAKELGLPLGTVSPVHSGLAFTERLGKFGNPTFEELRAVTAPNPTHILTDDDVAEIRALLAQGYMGADIAKRYGVSRALVSHIKNGKR